MRQKASERQDSAKCAMPVPGHLMRQIRARKREKGVTNVRTLQDALEFAFRPEFRGLWY